MKYFLSKHLNKEDPEVFEFFDILTDHKKGTASLKTDIKQTPDSYIYEIEIPGAKKEDVDLFIYNGYLTVTYDCRKCHKEKLEDNYVKKERHFGTMARSFFVGDISKDRVEAEYHDGVLTITIKKDNKEKEETLWINIK